MRKIIHHKNIIIIITSKKKSKNYQQKIQLVMNLVKIVVKLIAQKDIPHYLYIIVEMSA